MPTPQTLFEKIWNNHFAQVLERLAITEKVRDVDKQVAEQSADLIGVSFQLLDVDCLVGGLDDLHSALHAAKKGLGLVAAEIVSDLLSDNGRYFGVRCSPALHRTDGLAAFRQRARELGQLCAHFIGGQGEVDITRCDRSVGHRRMSRAVSIGDLGQGQTASFLDGLRTQGAVTVAAG